LHLKGSVAEDQALWDEFCPIFDKTVSLAAEVLAADTDTSSGKPYISLDLGIIGPLFDVASRCRDPTIRRKAIGLLESTPRQEGIWNASLAAALAQRLVEVEEEGLGNVTSCSDVPKLARLFDIEPKFDPFGRKATIRYSRFQRVGELVRKETVDEVFEW
jgi:hypothetical protein